MANVIIYTRDGCGYSTRAKALLQSKGVDFTEFNATVNPAYRAEMIAKANGKATFPQVFIGQTHVGGCDDLHALEAEGKLDSLLAA